MENTTIRKNIHQAVLVWVGVKKKREEGPQTSISFIIINQFHTHLCLISIGNLHYPIRTGEIKCHIKIQQEIHGMNQ